MSSILTSVTSRTETTININYQCDQTVTFIRYSINGGASWVGIDVADGRGGGYTVTQLTPATVYLIMTRATLQDGQIIESNSINTETFDYPHCTNAPTFTIGDRVTLSIYNPLSRSVNVSMIAADGATVETISTSAQTVTGFDSQSAIQILSDSLPSAQFGNYNITVLFGTNADNRANGVYFASTSLLPSISNLDYYDENNATTAITGNSKHIIQNQSSVTFTAAGLEAFGGAAVDSAVLTVNGINYVMVIDGNAATVDGITIDSAINLPATVTITDSRGFISHKLIEIIMIAWELPTLINNIARQNNFYSNTDLTVKARYSSVDNHNSITIQVRYKQQGTSTWGNYSIISDGATVTLSLDNTKSWDVQTVVTDLFGSSTYNLIVPIGMPIVFFDTKLNSVGINCFPFLSNDLVLNGNSLKKSVITAYLTSTLTDLTANAYTLISLQSYINYGDGFSFTNDGGVLIGSGITKLLISGRLSFNSLTSGVKHVRIVKNSVTNANTLAWVYSNITRETSVDITPTLAEVNAGDIVYLAYYTGNSTDVIGGNSIGARTCMTLETL